MNQQKMTKLCQVNNCVGLIVGRGFCNKHYKRFMIHGDENFVSTKKFCSIKDCGKKHKGKGFCSMHLARFNKHGNENHITRICDHPEICSVKDCGRKYATMGYCSAHYKRFKKDGNVDASKPLRIIHKNPLDYFELHVIKTEECWWWTGQVQNSGYGLMKLDNKNISAHRYSYKHYIDDINDGLFVCHKCDNKLCVNPSHLFLGTHRDNMRDMIKKGRGKGVKK